MTDIRPAIRFEEFMGDLDDWRARYIIGPYEGTKARNLDLQRLAHLPLGAPEYHGGQIFHPATMAEARRDWFDRTVEPEQVANATTQRDFRDAFWEREPWEDEDAEPDPYEPHPEQIAAF